MKALEVLLVGYGIVALTTFSAWAMYVFVTSGITTSSDPTTKLIWHVGRALPWAAVTVLGAGLFGVAAHTTWNLLGG